MCSENKFSDKWFFKIQSKEFFEFGINALCQCVSVSKIKAILCECFPAAGALFLDKLRIAIEIDLADE